ncbi:3-isopropylmalate dehydrogenase [candidate division WOR-3 bacterium 4484_100]|uniref:3-isopropylmalate dehydrogenase n=1 Tax=candidate division WOR-3 bacterium 4484_100 TaxID=1936077 RepID=A0A1V4QGM0_UNCW3|nr:MAG: 3-isopropylmalate dehydrogenase [candidate division WOR-3 bacterium 4484_100]
MAKYRIAWLPGDGIGKDVLDATKIVLERLKLDAEYIPGDIGWEFWCKEGDPLPERTIQLVKNTDCAMFGAITSKPSTVADTELLPELRGKGYVYRSPIVRIRQEFDLYICKRPCRAYQGNPLNYKENIDIVVFRENTEDLYAGVEFYPVPEEFFRIKGMERVPKDAAISLKVNTPKGCERIIRAAFEFARTNNRKKVTCVHKANVVRATDGLFLKIFNEIAKEYPGLEADNANVDSLCQWLLKRPFNYDVLVAPNLYGDIISDLCAQMVGGLGFGASANIGDDYALFEPTHGSAPKYAGMYKVNPIATIIAARMMLEWLGEEGLAQSLEKAVESVIREGKVRTYDMGGNATTLEMAQAIADKIGG